MALVKRKTKASPIVLSPPSDEIVIRDIKTDEIVPDENYSDVGIINGIPTEGTRALPLPKGKTLSFTEMMEYLSSFTDEQWTHAIAYVYRLFPLIDKKIIDPNASNSIDKISGSITPEEFVQKHGGGKFKVIVNDLDLGRDRKGRTVCYCVFEIPWTQFEPIINYKELLTNDEKNKPYITYLINKGILDGSTFDVVEPNTTKLDGITSLFMKIVDQSDRNTRSLVESIKTTANAGNNDANNLMRILLAERDKREDLLVKMMEGKDSGSNFDMMLKMIELMKPASTGENGTTALFQQIIQMQQNFTTQILELNKAKESQEPKKTLKDELAELKEVMELFGNGGGNQRRSTAEVVIDGFERVLDKVAGPIAQIFMAKMNFNPNAGMGNLAPTPTAQQPTTQTQQISQPDFETMAKQFIANYGQVVISQLDQGATGNEFAEDVIRMFGDEAYAQVKMIGKENIISAAKSVPAFWQRACINGGEENVLDFITNFFEGPTQEEEKI